jgi:hypothetical protein
MIGQKDKGINLEGVTRHHIPKRLPQMGDVFEFAQKPSSAVCHQCEKVRPAFGSRPPVFHRVVLVTSGCFNPRTSRVRRRVSGALNPTYGLARQRLWLVILLMPPLNPPPLRRGEVNSPSHEVLSSPRETGEVRGGYVGRRVASEPKAIAPVTLQPHAVTQPTDSRIRRRNTKRAKDSVPFARFHGFRDSWCAGFRSGPKAPPLPDLRT